MRVKVAKTVTSHNSVQAPNGNFGKTTLEQLIVRLHYVDAIFLSFFLATIAKHAPSI